jgi:ankyrin repeat protein
LLHRCAAKSNIEVAAVCLEFGADIDAMDTDACSTPLGWAAREGKVEMVEWLLGKGAGPNLPREKSWARPSAWAERRGHKEIVQRLKQFS